MFSASCTHAAPTFLSAAFFKSSLQLTHPTGSAALPFLQVKPAKASCCAVSRSKVFQCIPLGFSPGPLRQPDSQPNLSEFVSLAAPPDYSWFPAGWDRPIGNSDDRRRCRHRRGLPPADRNPGRAKEPGAFPANFQSSPLLRWQSVRITRPSSVRTRM